MTSRVASLCFVHVLSAIGGTRFTANEARFRRLGRTHQWSIRDLAPRSALRGELASVASRVAGPAASQDRLRWKEGKGH
jgi:hypothetical protein